MIKCLKRTGPNLISNAFLLCFLFIYLSLYIKEENIHFFSSRGGGGSE
jgi:hypothetical protein